MPVADHAIQMLHTGAEHVQHQHVHEQVEVIGVNESVGDWLIWLQIPLHVGTSWGLAVKGLWALAGLALPLLASTGLVMYWNRVLRHQLKRRG